MHKIVINSCFGGYGLSPLAVYEICKRKGLDCYIYVESAIVRGEYIKVSPSSKELKRHNWYAFNKDFGNVRNIDDNSYDKHLIELESLPRHDKDLVAVVEELGDKANGYCAELEVVEINSNLYRITEYDGAESIETPEYTDWIKVED